MGRPNPHTGLCRDDKVTNQAIRVLLQDIPYHMHPIGRALVVQPKEQDTVMCLPATKDQFAEILVVGNENPCIGRRMCQDIGIIRLRACFGDGEDVVPRTSKVFHDCRTGGLVHDEPDGYHSLC